MYVYFDLNTYTYASTWSNFLMSAWSVIIHLCYGNAYMGSTTNIYHRITKSMTHEHELCNGPLS
jgi:hypothetical protein